MIDKAPRIDIFQAIERKLAAMLFLSDPGAEGLLDDPTPRPLEPAGELIDLVRQGGGNMSRNHPRVHDTLAAIDN
jgi:hypothetical protein